MQSILEQITDWLKSMIISGIMGNLSVMKFAAICMPQAKRAHSRAGGVLNSPSLKARALPSSKMCIRDRYRGHGFNAAVKITPHPVR